MVQQFFRRLPIPLLNDDSKLIGKSLRSHRAYVDTKDDLGLAAERLIDSGFSKTDDSVTLSEEEVADSYLRTGGFLGRSKILGYLPMIRSNMFRLFHHHFTDLDSEV
ncbi:hypothetical protein Bca52824_031994 [Brassica carinata]|uniref:Uncharacterized protein n=1 Tax=Brassica carinata TaxID=52824 RepID=A0A8X7SBQ0_BRACI|nr:hypothetical protein Bca52824_031994 [Brassica carinata]